MATSEEKPGFSLARLLPLLILISLVALVYFTGWHEYLHARSIVENHARVQMFVDDHLVQALLIFMGLYIVAVALSIPGAAFLTIFGGGLFGSLIAGPSVVLAATIGATIIFLVAKTAFGDALAARAKPFLDRLDADFEEDAFNYLLFLRLVPVFPFWLVNIAPAFFGVKVRTYFFATLIGIVPGTFAYAFVGGGLTSIIQSAWHDPVFQACLAEENEGIRAAGSCPMNLDISHIITPQIIIALVALGLVALIPVVLRHRRSKKANQE